MLLKASPFHFQHVLSRLVKYGEISFKDSCCEVETDGHSTWGYFLSTSCQYGAVYCWHVSIWPLNIRVSLCWLAPQVFSPLFWLDTWCTWLIRLSSWRIILQSSSVVLMKIPRSLRASNTVLQSVQPWSYQSVISLWLLGFISWVISGCCFMTSISRKLFC